MARAARTSKAKAVEKIPRRPTPEFNESNSTMIQAIKEDGFLNVAMRDVNQFGPHTALRSRNLDRPCPTIAHTMSRLHELFRRPYLQFLHTIQDGISGQNSLPNYLLESNR